MTLVLEDYHLVDGPEVGNDVAFLLEHRPPQPHLAIGTRADPALPEARLRARGELVGVRAKDLSFTRDEAAAHLNGIHGLGLTAADVLSLEGRTEGWIAALELAAASLRHRDDKPAFISGFAGDDRFRRRLPCRRGPRPAPGRAAPLLLQTSVLERLCGALCEAVTGQARVGSTLELLEHQNLLIVALDDRRR